MLQPLRLEWWDAKDLQDNPHNWRRHPPAQEAALRQLLAEVGWAGAALYNERTKRLIDGHLRKRVLRKGQKIPVLVGNWTAEQELKILLALDPIASMASADKVALDQLSLARQSSSRIRRSTRYCNNWKARSLIRDLSPPSWQEPADQLEHADELQKKWKTALGQLWQAGPHRLICGDSTDSAVLGQLWQGADRRFQMIWTDPPWAVGYGEKTRWMERRGAQRRRTPIKNDSLKLKPKSRKLFGSALRTATGYAASGASIYAAVPSGSLAALLYRRARGRWVFLHGYLDLGQERDGARPERLSPSTRSCSVRLAPRRGSLLLPRSEAGLRFRNRSTAGQSVSSHYQAHRTGGANDPQQQQNRGSGLRSILRQRHDGAGRCPARARQSSSVEL